MLLEDFSLWGIGLIDVSYIRLRLVFPSLSFVKLLVPCTRYTLFICSLMRVEYSYPKIRSALLKTTWNAVIVDFTGCIHRINAQYVSIYCIQKSALETGRACWCTSLPFIGQPHQFLSGFDKTVILWIDINVIFVLTDNCGCLCVYVKAVPITHVW